MNSIPPADPNPVLPESDMPDPVRDDDIVIDESDSTPPQEPQASEEESPGISDSLAEEAKTYGFSDEDLGSYDEETLTKVMAAIDRRALSMLSGRQQDPGQQQSFQSSDPTGRQQGNPPGAPMPWQGTPGGPLPAQQPGQQPGQHPQSFELKIKEEDWDPELVKTLKDMHQHYESQISNLNQSLQQSQIWYQQQQAAIESQQAAQYTAWFDAKISELGDDFSAVFGKGDYSNLRHGSSELGNRIRLSETINQLATLYPQAQDDELFRRALRMEFGEVQSQLKTKQLSEQLKARSKQTIGRPSSKKTSPISDEVDLETGFQKSLIDEIQKEIDAMRST